LNFFSASDVAGVSGDIPQFAPKPCVEGDPRGKCGGSGGLSGSDSDLSLSGNFVANAAAAELTADNKKWLKVASTGHGVTLDFSGVDQGTCQGSVDELFGELVAAQAPADVNVQVYKDAIGATDGRHWVTVRRDEDDIAAPSVALNFSTGSSFPDALVEMVGSNRYINDGSHPRTLKFSNGAVRVVQRIDTNSHIEMTCEQAAGDDMTVTIAPAS